MPITTNPYCALADVKTVLGYDSSNTTDDALITLLIPQAQDVIDDYLGYSFQQDGTTGTPTQRLYDGNDKSRLFVGEVISISQVLETVYNAAVGYLGAYTVTTSTTDITADCLLGPGNVATNYVIYRKTGNPFSGGSQNYAVSGVFGYSSIPPRINRAAIRLTIHFLKMRDTNYADMISDSGMLRQHFSKQIPADVREILDNMRHRSFYSR